jgi:hypothetical protein
MRRLLPLLWPAAAMLAACGAAGTPAPPVPSGPSGSLGVVTAAAGAETVAALCDLRDTTARDAANATFFDRAHQHLHVLAAATENVDRVPAAGVLESMQVVEADLLSDRLPAGFGDHVEALLTATRTALEADGLPAPGC